MLKHDSSYWPAYNERRCNRSAKGRTLFCRAHAIDKILAKVCPNTGELVFLILGERGLLLLAPQSRECEVS